MGRTRAPIAPQRALVSVVRASLVLVSLVGLASCEDDILYNITEEQYFEMPQLFQLDEYEGCLATRGVYCMGSFELSSPVPSALFTRMQRYSANWVDNFNHTRLHRAWCVSRRCPPLAQPSQGRNASQLDEEWYTCCIVCSLSCSLLLQRPLPPAQHPSQGHKASQLNERWFSSCVNSSTMSSYNLSAHLYQLDYCERGPRAPPPPLSPAEQAFAALVALLLALAALSTTLDVVLSDQSKKSVGWALSWSLGACWRELTGPPRGSGALAVLDGLRVLCMFCVVIEHVCWLVTQAYLADTWQYEQMRRMTEVMLMVNSTLVVQIFFLMSSFLLAHKLLGQRERGDCLPRARTFLSTMLTRIIRISPSYWVVVWWAGAGWERAGGGPQWGAVRGEAATCRDKWPAHLLYLNNVLRPDHKCLIQTWYLAADMQLYAVALALTLLLLPLRRGAVHLLAALLLAAVAAPFAMAYAWNLMPTFVIHRPELVRQAYSGESSFNVLYQSPLSNAAGTLGGLLLAFVYREHYSFTRSQAFRVVSVAGPWLGALWAALSPRALGAGPPTRLAAAALAALERPVFAFFVCLGLLGALHGVKSPLRSFLAWPGWAVPARLSFGVLLLHLPIYKTLVASRLALSEINRQIAFTETFGVAILSGLAALPLALLVEVPAQRLHRALAGPARAAAAAGQQKAAQPAPAAPVAAGHVQKPDL